MNSLPANLPGSGTKALAVAKALRVAARRVRASGVAPSARGNIVVPERRWDGLFGRGVWIGFWLLVFCPVLVATVYFGAIASNRYVATAQFTIRMGGGAAEGLAALANQEKPAQDTDIVANYIASNGMLAALGRKLDMRAIYSRPGVDFLSRADPSASAEQFNKYWNKRIDVKVDSASSIVTVSVEAFTPADSLAVAQGVLAESERLINQMSDRSRRTALQESMATLSEAQETLNSKTRAIQDLRNKSGIIDAGATNTATTTAIGTLQEGLAELQIEYSSQLRLVHADAPQMQILARRIADTRRQIANLQSQATGPSRPNAASLAESTSAFDRANLDLSVAQTQYIAAVATVEKARDTLEQQNVYVLPFAEPTLPEQALYPRRVLTILVITAICLAVWGALVGIAALVRNNMAV